MVVRVESTDLRVGLVVVVVWPGPVSMGVGPVAGRVEGFGLWVEPVTV